jgi:hypothetical protein
MEKIEELVDEIRQLENDFAKALAGNESHAALRGIWKKIQELRDQLKLHMDESSSKKNSAATHFRVKN